MSHACLATHIETMRSEWVIEILGSQLSAQRRGAMTNNISSWKQLLFSFGKILLIVAKNLLQLSKIINQTGKEFVFPYYGLSVARSKFHFTVCITIRAYKFQNQQNKFNITVLLRLLLLR